MHRQSWLPSGGPCPTAALPLQSQVLVLPLVAAIASAAGGGELAERRGQFEHDYRQELLELAADAERQGFSARAQKAIRWRPPRPSTGLLLFIVDDVYAASNAQELSEVALTDEWDKRFLTLRRKYAEQIFALARQAADDGKPSLALQLATESLRENPDYHPARRVLGYEQVGGRWYTAFGKRMAASGKVWHDRFGWIREEDLNAFERDLRPLGRRWISHTEDARRHQHIDSGWKVRTDHFVVTSNHSREAAVAIAARLERVHQVWRQLFPSFYLGEREVRELFTGRRREPRRKPHQVVYHRDQDQYRQHLIRRQPQIGMTLGIYFDKLQQSHLFAGSSESERTQHHEVVHQLFQESRPSAPRVGALDNFWIVEGVACYFESLEEFDDPEAGRFVTIGTSNAGRLPTARHRALVDHIYVPLGQLVRLGMTTLQQREDIAQIYGEAAALVTFFMQYEGCRYQEALVDYLRDVYAGRANAATLSKIVGKSYQQLDEELHDYLRQLP